MTRAPAPFPLERLADIPDRPEDFRLLERIPLTREPQSWPLELSPVVGDEQPMVLLDTETTGLSADAESMIELGMFKVLYSPSATRVGSSVDVLRLDEAPGKQIPARNTAFIVMTG